MGLRRLSVASMRRGSRIRELQLEGPLLRGTSAYDYVVAALMAAVIGGALILGWIALVYFANRAFAMSVPTVAPAVAAVAIAYPEATWGMTSERVKGLERPRVLREDRWIFEFPEDQTEEEYARLLDTLGVELATPAGAKMLAYAGQFSGRPAIRTAPFREEPRMYFCWSDITRRALDVALLRKAGVRVINEAIVLQFLPDAVQGRLAKLEHDYRNRTPAEIRRTRFRVVRLGGGFDFEVVQQDYLK